MLFGLPVKLVYTQIGYVGGVASLWKGVTLWNTPLIVPYLGRRLAPGPLGRRAQQPDPHPAQAGADDGQLRPVHLCLQLLGADGGQSGHAHPGAQAGG